METDNEAYGPFEFAVDSEVFPDYYSSVSLQLNYFYFIIFSSYFTVVFL
jgi:hypothetical protein